MINGLFTKDGKLTMLKRFVSAILSEVDMEDDLSYLIYEDKNDLVLEIRDIYKHRLAKSIADSHTISQVLDQASYVSYLLVLAISGNLLDIAYSDGYRDFLCLDNLTDIIENKGRPKILITDDETNSLIKLRDALQFISRFGNIPTNLV